MNEQILRQQLLEAGAKAEDIEKIDFARLDAITESATDIEDFCKKMKDFMPKFNEEVFKETVAHAAKENAESENEEELSDDVLERVAGGSKAGDWFKENKDWLIPVAITAAGVAALAIHNRMGKTSLSSYGKEAKHSMEHGADPEWF